MELHAEYKTQGNMSDVHAALESYMARYAEAKVSVLSEFSGDTGQDLKDLYKVLKYDAERFGVLCPPRPEQYAWMLEYGYEDEEPPYKVGDILVRFDTVVLSVGSANYKGAELFCINKASYGFVPWSEFDNSYVKIGTATP